MNRHPSGRLDVCVGLGFSLGLLSLALAVPSPAMGETQFGGPSHEGGALVLSYASDLPQGTLVNDCLSFPRLSADEYRVDFEADGKPRVFVLYAVVPEGDPMTLAGVTYGIEYSESIELKGYGYCNGNGVVLPTPGFPESGFGMAISFQPVYESSPAPVAWFVISASEPGYFEVQPHPLPSQGGRMGNFDPKPHLEPVSGYGRIGFGTEKGFIPTLGDPAKMGICCLEKCYPLTEHECAFHAGLFLGPGKCDPGICTSETPGACCLPDGCEVVTRVDCFAEGGQFLGEGAVCSETTCKEGSK